MVSMCIKPPNVNAPHEPVRSAGFKIGLVGCPAPKAGWEAGAPPRFMAAGHGHPAKATQHAQRAFTLIELLLVLVILGILAAIVVPKFSGRTEQARETAARSQISTFGTALDAFEVDNGYYPKGKDGLQDLFIQPRDAKNWRGPYLKSEVPMDPWGNPYIYECPGKQNPSSYDLMSMGLDGREGGDDDIANWLQPNQRQR